MRGSERFVSTEPGLTSRHSFSFGRHYDPGNVGFGLLVMNNDDVLRPGAGYDTHPHRDVEIVTWVLEGALVHRDSTGAGGVVYPGLVQRLSAGRGVQHSEFNDGPGPRPEGNAELSAARAGAGDPAGVGDPTGAAAPLRFVQMWVPPSEHGVDPSYEQRDVSADLGAGAGLVTVASGMSRHAGVAAISLGQRAAAMHVARLTAGQPVRAGSEPFVPRAVVLPGAPFVHVYVARGSVEVEGIGRLDEGDAVRITDEGGRRVTASADRRDTGPEDVVAEIIIWEMHADVRGAAG
ncbi:pirin family protein [Phytoactinopolyspora alkaliphila]|uniref:Pirin family protein n=1 Tax=Phytoactinopolyspora alkaliphila TaxID=1783498 RepID=A0A6N9YNC2_9ACTN|nr:pirin-like bicupin family protein [Phytoactinopolyspora alkaliphila]NED96420.1 pirin family protein [Phytoactinopolyspora alkaliphila]